ncbi:MAG: SDR family oxidoreductase [Alphaproteobacteria bacterium]|nr:SDR family oxidoreductase [Alphaproteobacteria bacterium]
MPASSPPANALITGGAGGLGRAIAARLGARGMAVVLAGRDGAAAEKAAATLAAKGIRARGLALDVRDSARVNAVIASLAAEPGGVGVLVNNAGVALSNPVLEMTEAAWAEVIGVNLTGAFLCAQAFARARVAAGGGGAIVNVVSTSAFSARRGAAHYSASKAGLVMLTKSLALELGPHKIRVNAVAPSLIDLGDDRFPDAYRTAFTQMVPFGRIGEPDDVARAVAYLAGEEADFITGTVLPIDGGFLTGRSLPPSRG